MEMFLYGMFRLPLWGYALFLLIMTHLTIVTVTVYYHRAQAHRALEVHPWVGHFFRFWGWLTTGMNVKEWVSIHRKHHAKDDGSEDPHSPQVYGLWYVVFFGVYLYYLAAKDANLMSRYGHGTPKDWIERKLYSNRRGYMPYLGVTVMLVIDLVCFGAIGLLLWLVQMIWIPFWAAGVINGIGHWPMFKHLIGYRNNDTRDASSNIIPWGLWIGGEELHNNHHAYPSSAKLSQQWFEFDIGWMYIRLLESFGLAQVKYLMPQKQKGRNVIDEQTIALVRSDNGFVTAHIRQMLLSLTEKELGSRAFEQVHGQLSELRRILSHGRWNADALSLAKAKFPELKANGSNIPRVGELVEIIDEIKAPLNEVKTTPEREATLITRLSVWCESARRVSEPPLESFVRLLTQMASARTKQRA